MTFEMTSMDEMTLTFVRGAEDVRIWVDATLDGPYKARFEGVQPEVRETGSTIEFVNPSSMFDWRGNGPSERGTVGGRLAEVGAFLRRHQSIDLALNPRFAWRLAVRGGLSKLSADLRGLRLLEFDVSGGAGRVELRVDEVVGTVPVHVGGGASNVNVVRPTGTAASVSVDSGASKLTLDAQHFGAIGGRTRLETGDYQRTEDRLDLIVGGGASHVALTAAS